MARASSPRPKLGEDAQGNELTHPYMHVGSSPNSVDLAPGTTSGVLYAGMTGDGSKVFFTTKDKLVGGDTDTSADLYEAAVDSLGQPQPQCHHRTGLRRLQPGRQLKRRTLEHRRPHRRLLGAWRSPAAGGWPRLSGAVYFLSPEQLDGGKGTLNQPNLYLAQRGGSTCLRRHAGAQQPGGARLGQSQRDPQDRGLPDDAERWLRRLHQQPGADRGDATSASAASSATPPPPAS